MRPKSIKKVIVALSAAVFGLSALAAPAIAKPIPVESIAKHPAISSVALSPDGKHIAGLVAVDGERWPVISIWKTDNLDAKPIWIPTKEMRYLFVDFLGNDKIIFYADQPLTRRGKKDFTVKLYTADIDGRNIEEPLRTQGTLNDAVRNAESRGVTMSIFKDGDPTDEFVLINRTNVSNGSQEIYQLNSKTNRTKRIARSGDSTFYVPALSNPVTGDLLGKQELDNVDGDWWVKTYIRRTMDSEWVYHPELSERLKDRRNISIQGYDGNPDKLVVLSNANTEFQKAYVYNISTMSFDKQPLFENPKYDIRSVLFEVGEGQKYAKPVGVTVSGPGIETILFEGYWAGVKKSLESKFPKMDVSISDKRAKLKMAVITVSSSNTPPSYFIFKNGEMIPLGSSRPWMSPEDSGTSRWVTYTARDGLKIPAILTLPPGYTRAKGRIPTIVHPHGGPWARDYMGWDQSGWTQFLTSRGIAVIQPQYRGSTGVGMSLHIAGDKEWGQKMQDDKDDAAQFLVDQGIADPNKLAIFGYSYGGFAAIAASVRPNSPYQCAIAGAGVSSLDRIGQLWGSNRISKERQAWTVDGMDPLKNVDKANIPILLYHGDGDRQADTEHSRMFYSAMKSAGKDVEYIEIDTMWHTLPWWPEWHTESLTAIDRFLRSSKCNLI